MTRRRWFAVVMLLVPPLFFGAIELAVRLAWDGGHVPLFIDAPFGGGGLRLANPVVASRWFAGEPSPPAPSPELFAAVKPPNGFRVFVLGESAAQGFPYPRPGAFSRVLHDALRDLRPADSVEVINLGIAATNSFAMLDIADEVIAELPDAVVYYGGHNEYYGAFGAASSAGIAGAGPGVSRLFLRMQRLHSVLLVNRWLARRRVAKRPADAAGAASFMESVARDRQLEYGGPVYRRGLEQFEGNLERILSRFQDAGVPVFIGSVASNERDQRPFASPDNEVSNIAFAAANAALEAGDSVAAREGFARSRDLDVIRFRAPGAFVPIVRDVAAREGATYVPVAELIATRSPGGSPGGEFFLEHVHPNRAGALLIAQAYAESMMRAPALAAHMDTTRLRDWAVYDSLRALTSFDDRVAAHKVAALSARWPFRSADDQQDYRGSYRPSSFPDSIAFLVSAGVMPWELGKARVAQWHAVNGEVDLALANLTTLMRDQPRFETPWRLAGGMLVDAGRFEEGDSLLATAMRIQPTVAGALKQAASFATRRDLPRAIERLEWAIVREPRNPDAWFQLSLARALSGDAESARAAAQRVAEIAPGYPPLAGWLRTLGRPR